MPAPKRLKLVELNLGIADAALCRRNAARLVKDARRASEWTKLALYELALEEAAKGNMILMRRQLKSTYRSVDFSPGPGPAADDMSPEAKVFRLLVSHQHLLTNEALWDAFWDHDIKLEVVELLLSICEVALEVPEPFAGSPRGMGLKYGLYGAVGKIPLLRDFGLKELRKTVKKLRERGFSTLAVVGKRATFVDVDTETFRAIEPVCDYDLRWDLRAMIETLSILIKAAEGSAPRTRSP